MKSLFSVLGVLWLCGQSWPITWGFDRENDTQGWVAYRGESVSSALPLPAEVRDGIWRIFPGSSATVDLISPQLGYDSGLFDRLAIRFRVVGSQPLRGALVLRWTNTTNQNTPGMEVLECEETPCFSRFQILMPEETFTTDWQELVISDLRTRTIRETGGAEHEILWEGELIDLRLEWMLIDSPVTSAVWPEALEIDRMVLTGVEEQSQGELPPPAVSQNAQLGSLFGPPSFSPIDQKWLGGLITYAPATTGAMGDLDGDGDLDLVLPWGLSFGDTRVGWVAAFNDGQGGFGHPHRESVPFTWTPYINGADIDKDGRMDLLLMRLWDEVPYTQILRNTEREGWVPDREFAADGFGWADVDGDGDADLCLWEGRLEGASYQVLVYRNDGHGHFEEPPLILVIDPSRQSHYPLKWVYRVGQDQRLGILWGSLETPGYEYEVTYLDEAGEVVREHLATAVDTRISEVLYAGDIDNDRDVDLVVTDQVVTSGGMRMYRGVSILRNQGDGSFETVSWLPDVFINTLLQPEPVQFVDLNGDGLLDAALVDHNFRNPALVVLLGQPEGLPALEMRYGFEGSGGIVLAGDVDRDGDIDLVLARRDARHEGVYVFKNQRAERNTAVTEGQEAQPAGFRLGTNYPNPFNPQTWIPFEVPGGDQPVQLRVYNVLGQPVRTLVEDRLSAGPHLVPWDGRDSRGQEVSSGTYLYRLQVGGQQATGRMVKSE